MPQNNGLAPERCGALVHREIECLWCWFDNEQGTWTVARCVSDPDMDDFYDSGEVVAVVEFESEASRIVRMHNYAALAMLEQIPYGASESNESWREPHSTD